MDLDKELGLSTTPIEGLLLVELPVRADSRGWFKENWQREKMLALGLPDFGPVQHNVSFNDRAGTTRGIHAEPWDKWVSVASGRVFGAWVDLREGPGLGRLVTAELDPSRAVFVPRGVGNAFQTLEAGTAYTYLVNGHWRAEATYTVLDLADATVGIRWPIPLSRAEISDKDRHHPPLARVTPLPARRTLVLGADGQIGRALRSRWGEVPSVEYTTRSQLDLTDTGLAGARPWQDCGVLVNAAAFTGVDAAETHEGRRAAWEANATAVGRLARIATDHRLTLVHLSSDYVYDGTAPPYLEDAPVSPMGVYGQTKAAGELAAATTPRHYIIRTSWVLGDGHNFVRTMQRLAAAGVDPRVVGDQWGRLTLADDIAAAITHLMTTGAPFGTYNVTGSGQVRSWAEIAQAVFRLSGHDPARVTEVTTSQYLADAPQPTAPRPTSSVLDLTKITASGFRPTDTDAALVRYLAPNVHQ
ncbi:bifunctional dTDP-4-dehydrorhamnose 3,5-epimerase family protein/NAD(P)-dependent oxidoreductase [Ruania suaedae]|uniref:sugar nucleotide-binding protein n=1 Tax=Ruania suaedae TaxID=2897774 RepID=UPI001E633507|nr:bifunctional dTDP-4-dehydrorhamnose 3,5-epimerase family protein/NAD(P)-dependent oxidoreductase [Ruania suaedae]UFU02405.1 bifunctional dTDP-4-dehydrorhamnose 3,5-epimerase family protein/NAD(P)-dependent oxidoreductase [Ruania suaedae]